VDHFITEATFALPIYKWKSHDELKNEVLNFATESLDDGYTPIFQAYNLGKAQELMFWLKDLNHPMQIHGAGFKLCPVYEEFGFDLGDYSAYDRESCEHKILITPGSAIGNGFASNLKKTRIAYCSGWAAHESRRTQLTADALIPVSDHLDFFELIDVCKELNPGLVHVTHTPNPDVIRHFLEKEGINSTYLGMEADTGD
jgi:putative mRNA 3-end processing factor